MKEEIIEKAKLKASFGFIYRSYANKLFDYFWYRVGFRKSVAEDLVQETFYRAFKKIPSFKDRGLPYFTYLMRVAHNLLVNYYRAKSTISLENTGDIATGGHLKKIEKKMEAEQLWKAVGDLSDNEQDVILMKYKREMSVRDISQVMDKSENAIKLMLSRARKKLAHNPYVAELIF